MIYNKIKELYPNCEVTYTNIMGKPTTYQVLWNTNNTQYILYDGRDIGIKRIKNIVGYMSYVVNRAFI